MRDDHVAPFPTTSYTVPPGQPPFLELLLLMNLLLLQSWRPNLYIYIYTDSGKFEHTMLKLLIPSRIFWSDKYISRDKI